MIQQSSTYKPNSQLTYFKYFSKPGVPAPGVIIRMLPGMYGKASTLQHSARHGSAPRSTASHRRTRAWHGTGRRCTAELMSRVTSRWGQKFFFPGSFPDHAAQLVKLSIFHQALINIVHQTRLTFDVEIETTHDHPPSFRTGHMGVGDSAEEFILIHALGRERLLVLSCGLPSNTVKVKLGDDREFFVLVFYTPAAKYVFNRSLIGARHKLPAVEGALYTKEGSKPLTSSPRSDFTTLSLISSNDVWRTRNHSASNPRSA